MEYSKTKIAHHVKLQKKSNEYIYEVQDLESARAFLHNFKNPVILTNPLGSTRYYGILVIDYMFKTLKKEFPQVKRVMFNIGNDRAAFCFCNKLSMLENESLQEE